MSQSPQTGQVYFNELIHNSFFSMCQRLNPLKRVKFISILSFEEFGINPMSYMSQSPQTGQVYFNLSQCF